MNKLFFVVCGNLQEFKDYVRNKNSDLYDYRYVYDTNTLRGFSNPIGCLYGTWREKEDIQDIIMQLIISKTDGSNKTLKNILMEITKSS